MKQPSSFSSFLDFFFAQDDVLAEAFFADLPDASSALLLGLLDGEEFSVFASVCFGRTGFAVCDVCFLPGDFFCARLFALFAFFDSVVNRVVFISFDFVVVQPGQFQISGRVTGST